jgi:hypothetical protein
MSTHRGTWPVTLTVEIVATAHALHGNFAFVNRALETFLRTALDRAVHVHVIDGWTSDRFVVEVKTREPADSEVRSRTEGQER